jgi:A/G-specific adenine glycosylase
VESAPQSPLPAAQRAELHDALTRWYRATRRDLPWRRTRDPYAIWISEAMLQQTRVETVVPYYERFLAALPDVRALAAASEERVVGLWSGLGYYSRARALRRAAQAIVTDHGGRMPTTRADWLALPGVGPYTAGAVCSIALGLPEPLVDGNVARVLARWFELEEPVGSSGLQQRCWARAEELMPGPDGSLDPGDWNQALMELGARLCTARSPACETCPVRPGCAASASGRVAELPRPRPRRAPVEVELEMLLAEQPGAVLLVRRPERGRMAGLWELPTREISAPGRAHLWPESWPEGLGLVPGRELARLTHAITHHRVRASLRASRSPGDVLPGAGLAWVDEASLEDLPLTGLTRKALRNRPGVLRP